MDSRDVFEKRKEEDVFRLDRSGEEQVQIHEERDGGVGSDHAAFFSQEEEAEKDCGGGFRATDETLEEDPAN